jgi:tetratricopeptide (TPR) repeat protein
LLFAILVSFAACWTCAWGQTTSGYDSFIQKGRTELRAGKADQALAAGEQAIKLDAMRWEGYALAGGALMNLKRFEEAADDFNEALKRAPQAKQPGLRRLRRQCLLDAAGGSQSTPAAPPANTNGPAAPPSPGPAPSPATAGNVTQAEIVLWESIKNSTNPSDFQTYLNQYPKGAFAALAQRRLAEAKAEEQARIQEQRKRDRDSVWTDSNTSLMWTRQDNGTDVGWNQALSYCQQLRLLGYTDWRMPTYNELKEIHARSWTGRGKIKTEFHLSNGAGALWTSSPAGLGGYFSGKLAQSGYLIFPEPNKANGMRTLCVRNADASGSDQKGSN